MVKRLLDRQVSLLHYLTSGDAIFRERAEVPLDAALVGIDRGLLGIEARFSHEKRMEKIAAVFPRTFALIGSDLDANVREFVDACPPVDISRIENAHQFHDFLSARWRRLPPAPPYLPDVAACELAYAKVRVEIDDRPGAEAGATGSPRDDIRRNPGVALLRSAYDIRPIFENAVGAAVPAERDTRLAIVHLSLGAQPRIFELAPAVFDLLGALDDWADRAAFDELPEADELISDLTEAGLLEVHR